MHNCASLSLCRHAEDMQCDRKLPCDPCEKACLPCSNCLLPAVGVTNTQESPCHSTTSLLVTKVVDTGHPGSTDRGRPLEIDDGSSGDCWRPNSASRAQSVASGGTSHSVTSTQSARYNVKYNRRLSAHNRRHSADSNADKRAPNDSKADRRWPPVSLQVRPSSQHSRRSSSSMRADGRADYFRCHFFGCPEVFTSMPLLKIHKKVSHFKTHCTFCNVSFRHIGTWRFHEQMHLIKEGTLYSSDDMLWSCGICSMHGLSETRRYLHIRQHWQEGNSKADWSGKPKVMLLTPEEAEQLLDMSEEEFQDAAQQLLSNSASRKPSSHVRMKAFLHTQSSTNIEDFPTKSSVGNATGSSRQSEEVKEAARPMVHGLFASIRKTFLRMKTNPPW